MRTEFNPHRLSLARRRRGLTKVQLAQELDVSVRIIVSYERGDKSPGPLNLLNLARTLDFPPGYFSGPDLEEPPLAAASFRALTNLTARHRDQALSSGAFALALSEWIDARFSLPTPSVPQIRGVDAETAVMAIRREWGLGQAPVRNMVHLLESKGVRVFSLAEECRELDAFSFWLNQVPYIFINTMKSAEHSRMDAAHELGHLVLHWREGVRGRAAEHEADLFGSIFLMPSDSVRAEAPRGGKLQDILQSKKYWNVSATALTYRMKQVGLLSDWQYRSLFVDLSQRGYRRMEPDGSQPETSQLLAKVFGALREEGISKSQIAAELEIAVSELEKMIFGLVLTTLEGTGGTLERKSNLRLL